MKMLEELYKECPEYYRMMAIEANKRHKKLVVLDGKLALEDIEQPTPTYLDERKANYPSIEEQLDMIWHAIDEGKPLDNTSEFYLKIKEVKNRYKKES